MARNHMTHGTYSHGTWYMLASHMVHTRISYGIYSHGTNNGTYSLDTYIHTRLAHGIYILALPILRTRLTRGTYSYGTWYIPVPEWHMVHILAARGTYPSTRLAYGTTEYQKLQALENTRNTLLQHYPMR